VFQFGQPLRFFSGYTYTSVPQGGLLNVSPDSPVTSPDGKSNYLLRAAPTVISGVNTADIIIRGQINTLINFFPLTTLGTTQF